MSGNKDMEVITFKVDKSMKELLSRVSNRSEFIRNAILCALDDVCPFCKGTGVLNEHRKKHWEDLAKTNEVPECSVCKEVVLGSELKH